MDLGDVRLRTVVMFSYNQVHISGCKATFITVNIALAEFLFLSLTRITEALLEGNVWK
jgi:hypothetical protein